MEYSVVVRPEAENKYVAQALAIPEIKAEAATEAEAVEQVSQALQQWLASAKVVQVSVPAPQNHNPWLEAFGRSADDPDFEDFVEELKRARSEEPVE
jgi:predicted RNase H-like HicB family nuclease